MNQEDIFATMQCKTSAEEICNLALRVERTGPEQIQMMLFEVTPPFQAASFYQSDTFYFFPQEVPALLALLHQAFALAKMKVVGALVTMNGSQQRDWLRVSVVPGMAEAFQIELQFESGLLSSPSQKLVLLFSLQEAIDLSKSLERVIEFMTRV